MKKSVSAFLLVVVIVLAVSLFSIVGVGEVSPPPPCSAAADYTISGTVYNSTYGLAATNLTSAITNYSVNVSLYNMTFSNVGEPSRQLVNWTTTNDSALNPGNFTLTVASANCFTSSGPVFYVLEVARYNASSWNAYEIGPSFPPLPITQINWTFNRGNVYMQNASTLKLNAFNSSGNVTFNYILFDDSLGFPLAENFNTKVATDTVIVPRNRNYTAVFMRAPEQGGDFTTAVPPLSLSVKNATNYTDEEFVIELNKSMAFSLYNISGSINVTGNTTSVNVTNVLGRLGLAGILPPNSYIQVGSPTVITNATVTGSESVGYHIADYRIQVMGAAGNGIYQAIEWYASNTTSTNGDGEFLSYANNFTVTEGNQSMDVVLSPLAGNRSSENLGSVTLTTAFLAINVTDESGVPLDDANMELRVNAIGHKDKLPTFRHMLFSLSGGVSRIPVFASSNATLRIFNKRFAPTEVELNVTNASQYPEGVIQVKLSTFKPRQFNANGSVEEFNGSNKASSFRMVMMQNSPDCNVYNASISDCRLGNEDFDVGGFDPLKAMVGGKVNIYSEINTTGVIIYFVGVDMIASGPPEGAMSEQPLSDAQTSGGSRKQTWRFGSVAPPIYDKVFVGIPYNESKFNTTDEYNLFNISLRYLLDDNGGVIWNSTIYPNGTNIPDDYSDYHANWTNASSMGMKCVNETGLDTSIQQCFVNTTSNYIWLNLPHFSDVDPELDGEGDTTPPAEGPTGIAVSTNLSAGFVNITWNDIDDETGETYIVYRFSSNISTYNLSLLNITNNGRIGGGVQSFVDNTTKGDNATVYYYTVVAVDSNGNLNTSSGSPNITNSVNVTVADNSTPKSPAAFNISGSGSKTATLMWANVTEDVDGNPDMHGMQFKVYRSAANATDSNASTLNLSDTNNTANASRAIRSATVTTVSSNSTTFSISAGGTGVYHFIVTSLDDNSNENLSWQMSTSYFNVSLNEAAASSGSGNGDGSSGGNGGGGGSGPDPSAGVSQSRLWDVIEAGSSATFEVTKTGIPVSKVTFSVTETVNNVEITVTKLDSKPSHVSVDYGGEINTYISVAKSNVKDTAVPSATIKFKVEKSWLSDKGGLASDVVLIRYDLNKWSELPTVRESDDELFYHYTAESPGLSTFAIALKAKDVGGNQTGGPGGDGGGNLTADGNQTGDGGGGDEEGSNRAFLVTAIIVIIIAVVFGAVGIVYYRKNKGSSEGDESSEGSGKEPA